jgi:hypothetical protein
MSVLILVCFAVATILATLAAFYAPPAPPRVSLLSLAVAFLALGFMLERWLLPG